MYKAKNDRRALADRRRARAALALTAALAVLGLGACGGKEDEASGDEAPASSSAVPFDRAFIDAMVPHHESAIEMARAAKEAGLSEPELVEIANAIETTQQDEIDRMREWRDEWYGSSEVDPEGAEALGLSEDEMGMQHGRPDFSASHDVDSDFASLMIDHHEGAVAMARLAQARAQHSAVRELADTIIEAQEREIGLMEKHAGGAMEH